MKAAAPTDWPGLLVAIEGLDGAGKTTQIELLQRWLEFQCYSAVATRRRESKLLAKSIERARETKSLTPLTYCLIHLADFSERLETVIVPSLAAGRIVLVDQYIYTSFVRDGLRGIDAAWVRRLYSFAPEPDAVFFLRLTAKEAIRRATMIPRTPDLSGAGLDPGPASRSKRSHEKYMERQAEAYDTLAREFDFIGIDGQQPIPLQQRSIRKVLARVIRKKYRAPIAVTPGLDA